MADAVEDEGRPGEGRGDRRKNLKKKKKREKNPRRRDRDPYIRSARARDRTAATVFERDATLFLIRSIRSGGGRATVENGSGGDKFENSKTARKKYGDGEAFAVRLSERARTSGCFATRNAAEFTRETHRRS